MGVRVLRMGLCQPDVPYSLDARLKECGAKRGEKGLQTVLKSIDVVAATRVVSEESRPRLVLRSCLTSPGLSESCFGLAGTPVVPCLGCYSMEA